MNNATQTNRPVNPLLSRAEMPGEHFPLPSMGIFYKNGELSDDVKNGEIYIKPMVTLDEIIMKSPDKLYTGEAITEVFKRCVPQILKPMDLLSNDIDYILTALRKISFGNVTEISYEHNCKESKGRSFDYKIQMSDFLSGTKVIDPTKVKHEYEKVLSNGQSISLAPPRFLPSMQLYQANLEKDSITPEVLEKKVMTNLASMILKVDEVDDFEMILEWVRILKPTLIKEIRDFVNETTAWGTDFTTKIKCKGCGKDIDITSEMNPISFFFL